MTQKLLNIVPGSSTVIYQVTWSTYRPNFRAAWNASAH